MQRLEGRGVVAFFWAHREYNNTWQHNNIVIAIISVYLSPNFLHNLQLSSTLLPIDGRKLHNLKAIGKGKLVSHLNLLSTSCGYLEVCLTQNEHQLLLQQETSQSWFLMYTYSTCAEQYLHKDQQMEFLPKKKITFWSCCLPLPLPIPSLTHCSWVQTWDSC